jgi:hypothetical protein
MPRHLELKVEGKPGEISLESFSTVIKNAFDILTNLDSAISAEPRGSLDWFVTEVAYGSLVVTIEARPRARLDGVSRRIDVSSRVVESFVGGFEHIRRQRTIPPYFSDYDLKKAQAIANVLRRGGATAVVLRDIEQQSRATIEPDISPDLTQMLSVRYQENGSVEGKLEMVSVHATPRFTVYHAISLHAVRCKFDPAIYLERVRNALGRRVTVTGQVHFNYKHEPIRVDIEEVDILPGEGELPTPSELRGMSPDFTGDLTTEEYLRRLRSG